MKEKEERKRRVAALRVYCTEEVAERIRRAAERRGQSVSDWAWRCLDDEAAMELGDEEDRADLALSRKMEREAEVAGEAPIPLEEAERRLAAQEIPPERSCPNGLGHRKGVFCSACGKVSKESGG